MGVLEIVEAKRWRHVDGQTASLYGAVPYLSEQEKGNWSIENTGWTFRRADGTIRGPATGPLKTREEAVALANKINALHCTSTRKFT